MSGTPTGPRRLLLVLDNFEHLTPAAPAVGQLLAACPDLVILVTSRDVLRLPGERDYALPPLALPPAGRENTVDDLLAAPAVRLFVERVQEVRPGFVAGVREAPVIAEICRRLDGLPLASSWRRRACGCCRQPRERRPPAHRIHALSRGRSDGQRAGAVDSRANGRSGKGGAGADGRGPRTGDAGALRRGA